MKATKPNIPNWLLNSSNYSSPQLNNIEYPITNLKIIPTHVLNTIPFEALLTEGVTANAKALNRGFFSMQERKRDLHPVQSLQSNFLSIDPILVSAYIRRRKLFFGIERS